jgi:hypothetical protein
VLISKKVKKLGGIENFFDFFAWKVRIKGDFEVLKKVFYFPYMVLKERVLSEEIR